MENEENVSYIGGAKNALQELCVALGLNGQELPIYKDVNETGPAHCKQFTVSCEVAGITCVGISTSKRQASKLAASKVLKSLEHLKPRNERDKKTIMSILMFDKADNIVNAVKNVLYSRDVNECVVLLDDGAVYEDDFNVIVDRSLQMMFESGMTDLSAWERIIECVKSSATESNLLCNYHQGDRSIMFKRSDGIVKFEDVDPLHYDEVIKLYYGDVKVSFGVLENDKSVNYVRCCKEDGNFSYDVLNTNLCKLRDDSFIHRNIRRVLYINDRIHDDMDIDFKQLRELMYSIFAKCRYSLKAKDSRFNQDRVQGSDIEPTVTEYA